MNYNLKRLYEFYDHMKENNYPEIDIQKIKDLILDKEDKLNEDVSATGGPSGAVGGSNVGSIGVGLANATTAGMGAVVQSQPSAFPGALNGTDWMRGGGSSGSGDISVPYNPSGKNRVFQHVAMGKNHGAKTGKKSRVKPLDLKALKNSFKKKDNDDSPRTKKVMNFDDFAKDKFNKVTKIKEGKLFKATSKKYNKKEWDSDAVDVLKGKIESHVKSQGGKVKKNGDSFEIEYSGKILGKVIFKKDVISIQKKDSKFPKNFIQNELGKMKSEISEIIKKHEAI